MHNLLNYSYYYLEFILCIIYVCIFKKATMSNKFDNYTLPFWSKSISCSVDRCCLAIYSEYGTKVDGLDRKSDPDEYLLSFSASSTPLSATSSELIGCSPSGSSNGWSECSSYSTAPVPTLFLWPWSLFLPPYTK